MATPSERSLNASIASNERWARETNRTLATAAARANGPASIEYWAKKVDPDGEMSHTDRMRAADNAKKAFYARLSKAGVRGHRRTSTT